MEKWTIQYCIFTVKSFIKSNSMIRVQRTFRQLFGINGIGTANIKSCIVKSKDEFSVLT